MHGKTALAKRDKEILLMDATKEEHPALMDAVWVAYREIGWPTEYGPAPHATQWKTQRRWARNWLKQQPAMGSNHHTLPPSVVWELLEWADTPNTAHWPLAESPPIAARDLKLLRVALCIHPHLWP
jgi:hypothetical protein